VEPITKTCRPRKDVLEGGLADNHFAAQLDQVVRKPKDYPVYGNPDEFFALIAMIGEGKTRGQSAILDVEASTNQNVAGILLDKSIMSPEYVWRWALAQYEVTRAVGRGGNQPALNGEKVRELTIPVLPLEEQTAIVSRVDELISVSDGLLARVEIAGRRAERSSHAVLAKAFGGELSLDEELGIS
jgi:type I restriction enzyme S subunit